MYTPPKRRKRVVMNEDTTIQMLTIREASHLLSVHSNTLRRWSDQGLVKTYRIGLAGHRRFKPEDIAALLMEQTQHSQASAGNVKQQPPPVLQFQRDF